MFYRYEHYMSISHIVLIANMVLEDMSTEESPLKLLYF